MNKQQKELVIKSLGKDFATAKGLFFINYSGLTVNQMQSLRRGLNEKDARLKVAKMRLIKRAIEDLGDVNILLPHCKEQLGIVFADSEATQVAKTLYDFSKKFENLKLVVGCLDAQLLDKQAVVRIASLPSKEVLLAQVCGTLNAPIVSFARILNILLVRLLWTLKEIEKNKQLGA